MNLYIPQNVDPYNTHLKNLIEAYLSKGVEISTGYGPFISSEIAPDAIHFHQFEGLLSSIRFNEKLFFDRLEYFKANGSVFLYTAHNLEPHKKPFKDYNKLQCKFFGYVDLFIHHGAASEYLFKNRFKDLLNKRHIVCHHGDYLEDMRNFKDLPAYAKDKLGLPAEKKLILIFGQLQYKNTDFAFAVFNIIRVRNKKAFLILAGVKPVFRINRINRIYYRFNNKVVNLFRKNNIMLLKRFSQHETYLLFKAADVVFLPHKSGLTTGIIPLAATLGKPFVYPDIGVFGEQAEHCYAEKYDCSDVEGAAAAIERILNSEVETFDNSLWLAKNNWSDHVEKILLSI